MLLEGYNGFAMIKIEKEMKEVNSKEFSVVKIIQDPVDSHNFLPIVFHDSSYAHVSIFIISAKFY